MATFGDTTANEPSQDPVNFATTQDMPSESNGPQTVEASVDTETKSHGPLMCGICEKNQSKYKCSRCYLPYCSVACNKIHRENHPADPDPAPRLPSPPLQPPSVDAHGNGNKQARPFEILEQSEQLQYLFRKYPRLRAQLLDIHAATIEPASAQSRIPASLLKDLPGSGSDWNTEKGIESGKQALRKARTAKGEDGEAIREYSELVLHLMDKATSRTDG